ncbi:prephenate dehydrogenase/arogenate dehydrogenase family protein [Asanoa sp. NPDC049518]|uniref:prephenate dehydrogenase/arogenate dehydrogenase family protein n=1 Tax=unclassified Asanoa TaxID=2685164 RepID=UPI00342CC9BB
MDIAVIGLGLIGGSALRALAARGHRVLGYDADPATRATARTAAARAPQNARWQIAGTIRDTVTDAGLVLVAVPLPALPRVFDEIAATGYTGLVTDVTSVKTPVRMLVEQRLQARHQRLSGFVGGHPMAGKESSGFGAADADLFHDCAWVLCFEPGQTSLGDWLDLAELVIGLGARVVPTTAEEHDRAVATISHVPHLLATALAASAADPLAGALAAGSFRDGTRVAATRPELVAAMCGGNAPAVAPTLDGIIAALQEARAALAAPDPISAVLPWLAPGHAMRAGWPPPLAAPLDIPARPDALLRLGRAGGWVRAVAADRSTVSVVRPAPRGPGGLLDDL